MDVKVRYVNEEEKEMFNLIMTIVIGGICGWLAGKIMNLNGSILFNIVLGILGGFVGGIVLGLIGFRETNIIGSIISGVLGSCILVAVVKAIRK